MHSVVRVLSADWEERNRTTDILGSCPTSGFVFRPLATRQTNAGRIFDEEYIWCDKWKV